jgi:hypothetical protein
VVVLVTISGPLSIPRTAVWVWHAAPRSIFGVEAVLVRCATGTSPNGGTFDFAANYRRWSETRGPVVIPWTWFGPPASSDGRAAADLLCNIAPGKPVYVVEIQRDPPAEEVVAFARRMREREPTSTLGFSSLPTREEARMAGVPWEACVAEFDIGFPQVYTPAQRERLLQTPSPVVADMAGKPIHVAVFPDSDSGWLESARAGVARHAGASAWAVDQSSFPTWRRQLSALPTQQERGPGGAVARRAPGEETLMANRIVAIVQAHLDAGGKLGDDQLVSDVERALRDGTG